MYLPIPLTPMIYVRAYFGIAFCEDAKLGCISSPLIRFPFDLGCTNLDNEGH